MPLCTNLAPLVANVNGNLWLKLNAVKGRGGNILVFLHKYSTRFSNYSRTAFAGMMYSEAQRRALRGSRQVSLLLFFESRDLFPAG
jgi:hypothetical protein